MVSEPWSDEDIEAFEAGMRLQPKRFRYVLFDHLSGRNKTLAQVMQFYYTWKKLPRYSAWKRKSTTMICVCEMFIHYLQESSLFLANLEGPNSTIGSVRHQPKKESITSIIATSLVSAVVREWIIHNPLRLIDYGELSLQLVRPPMVF